MYARDTSYQLAYSPNDFSRCHALLEGLHVERSRLAWPTVMALRGDVLIGCLSRIPSTQAVIAGPLAVTSTHPLLTTMRLVEAWEGVLWSAGIRSYHFGIQVPEHKAWLAIVEKLGLQPYDRSEQVVWFKRILEERQT
jgi:hypothetical protein